MKGKFLIASSSLHDLAFYKTVVLITDFDKSKGAMGVIINRAGPIYLSEICQEILQKEVETGQFIHAGGPVVSPVLSLHNYPDLSEHQVMPGVFLSSKRENIEKLIMQSNAFTDEIKLFNSHARFYLGSAIWQKGQLEEEINRGSWHVEDGLENIVFYNYHLNVYKKLLARKHRTIFHQLTKIPYDFIDKFALN